MRGLRSRLIHIAAPAFIVLVGVHAFGQSDPAAVAFGIVADNSGSLRQRLDSLVSVSSAIVDAAGTGDRGFLVRFTSSQNVVLFQAMTSDRDKLKEAAEGMFIEGGQTAIIDALRFSAKYLAESPPGAGRRGLILITDGDDRENVGKREALQAELRTANIPVFVIGIASEAKVETKTVDAIAKASGGRVFLPKGRGDWPVVIKEIFATLRGK